MPYVTEEYYKETYKGEPVEDFPKLCKLSELLVDEMTMYRVKSSFSSMSDDMQEIIRHAVCAQIEFLDSNGGASVLNEVDVFQSASLGKFNYSKAASAEGYGENTYSPLALRYLMPTGLLYRGGCV